MGERRGAVKRSGSLSERSEGRLERSLAASGGFGGGAVTERAVGTSLVVFVPPCVDEDAGFGQGAEKFAVEAFVAQFAVE